MEEQHVKQPVTDFSETEAPRVNTVLEEATLACASKLHDAWREPRKLADGTYEPRIKEVNGVEYDIKKNSYYI